MQDTIGSSTGNILILDRRRDVQALNKEANARDLSTTRPTIGDPIIEEDEENSTKSPCNDQNMHGDRRLVLKQLVISEKGESFQNGTITLKGQEDRMKSRDDVQAVRENPPDNVIRLPEQFPVRNTSNRLLTTPKLISRSSNARPVIHIDDDLTKSCEIPSPLPPICDSVNCNRAQHSPTSASPAIEIPKRSRDVEIENDEKSDLKNVAENCSKLTKTSRYNRNGCSFKKRTDPTEELNSKSSIQAMQGKTYQVFSYRRDSRGNLQEESRTMDTTIDVSRYFNFDYYRNRNERHRMLENSGSLERKQKKRVCEFLMKLDQDQESVRRQAEMKAKEMEEERLDIQKREAGIIKKPPRYGLQREYTITPGYVRKYRIRSGSRRLSRDKRKSSWHLPSLYTLNMKLSNQPTSHAPGKLRRTADIQEMHFACSGHLVNINL